MTKDQFRELAISAVGQLLDMPDDIWEMTRPIISLWVGDECVTVGIKHRDDDDDD